MQQLKNDFNKNYINKRNKTLLLLFIFNLLISNIKISIIFTIKNIILCSSRREEEEEKTTRSKVQNYYTLHSTVEELYARDVDSLQRGFYGEYFDRLVNQYIEGSSLSLEYSCVSCSKGRVLGTETLIWIAMMTG